MNSMPYAIKTPRFTLRCWSPADAPLVKNAVDRSLASLKPWMNWTDDAPYPLEQQIDTLRKLRSLFDGDQEYVYGIFTPDESCVMGGTGLHPRIGPDALEIGYWIAEDFQGKGYATEITRVLTDVAFRKATIDRLEIHVHPGNRKSARVPEKLGYELEAVLKRRMRDTPGHGPEDPQDMMLWSMFRNQWVNLPKDAYSLYDCMGKPLE